MEATAWPCWMLMKPNPWQVSHSLFFCLEELRWPWHFWHISEEIRTNTSFFKFYFFIYAGYRFGKIYWFCYLYIHVFFLFIFILFLTVRKSLIMWSLSKIKKVTKTLKCLKTIIFYKLNIIPFSSNKSSKSKFYYLCFFYFLILASALLCLANFSFKF